jgi:hypothetical protein
MKARGSVGFALRAACVMLALAFLFVAGEAQAEQEANKWSALGSGVNKYVNAVVVRGSDVYVGGGFTTAGGIAARHIAKWNTTTNTWSALASTNGPQDGYVAVLVVKGKKIYAGGDFSGGLKVYNTAKNSWKTFGGGVQGTVSALAFDGTDLYVGGDFDMVGGSVAAQNIAKYDMTTKTWSPLGTGTTHQVWVITMVDHKVYAGGDFLSAGGVANSGGVAMWDGANWNALGTGVNGPVFAITPFGNALAIGGGFSNAGPVDLDDCCLAAWDIGAQTWSNMGHGVAGGTYIIDGNPVTFVWAITFVGNDMYVAGSFTFANEISANNIAKSNVNTHDWNKLGKGTNKDAVWAMANHATTHSLFVGGEFTKAGGLSANHIAKWNTQ